MATRKPSNPDAVAIHAVAKAANLSSRELMDAIAQWDLGWDATNHMKRLSPEQIEEVERRLTVDLSSILPSKGADKKPAEPAASKAASEKKPRAASKQKAADKADTPPPSKQAPPAKDATPQASAKDASSKAKTDKPAKDAPNAAAKDAQEKPSAAKGKDAPAPKDAKGDDQAAPRDAAPSAEEIAERAKEVLSNILDGMGFPHPRIRVDVSSDAVRISLAGRGTADILGQRNASARTDILEALQLVVQKALFGNDHRNGPSVAIDVMGFREGREQELRAMAERMAEYVSKTGNVLRVAAMNFIDRRAVHQGLSELDDIRTESTGYGASRALEVSKDARAKRSKDDRKDERSDDRNDAPKETRNKDRNDAPRGKKPHDARDDDAQPTDDKKGGRGRGKRAQENADEAKASAEKPAPKSAKNEDSRSKKGKGKQKDEEKPASDAKADNAGEPSGERKKSSRAPRKPKATAGKDTAPQDDAKQNTDDAQ